MGLIWDILVPGGLMRRREERQVLGKTLDETLIEFGLQPEPPAKVGLTESEFRQLVDVIKAKLAPYNSKFSGEDVVKAIRERGYQIKVPEKEAKKKPRIPIWVWIVAAVALVLAKQKEEKR